MYLENVISSYVKSFHLVFHPVTLFTGLWQGMEDFQS